MNIVDVVVNKRKIKKKFKPKQRNSSKTNNVNLQPTITSKLKVVILMCALLYTL